MNRVMVDLETLSLADDAVIISIGAVLFNPLAEGDGIVDEFYQVVCQQDQVHRWGRVVSEDTLAWWDKQSPAAREALELSSATGALRAPPLDMALRNLSRWWGPKEMELWAKPIIFDGTVLRRAYAAVGMQTPWSWHAMRCLSTIRALGLQKSTDIEARGGTAHNALDDARLQALYAVKWLRDIDKGQRVLASLEVQREKAA
jgi:hypothetical protein